MHDQVVLPTLFASLSLFRNIYIRECIEIVHGHSAFSTLAHEGILIARLLGLKVICEYHYYASSKSNTIEALMFCTGCFYRSFLKWVC